MDYGINLATAANSWKVVKRAEELGFTRAWFYDTQLLNAEIFVAMGAAAVTTSRTAAATTRLRPRGSGLRLSNMLPLDFPLPACGIGLIFAGSGVGL